MKPKNQVVSFDSTCTEMGVMEREVAESERAYQRLSKGLQHTRDGVVNATEEMDEPEWLDRLETIAKRIARTDRAATELTRRKTLGIPSVHYIHRLTSLGEDIMAMMREAVPLIETLYPGRYRRQYPSRAPARVGWSRAEEGGERLTVEFNPWLTVMLRACQKAMPVVSWHRYDPAAASDGSVRKALDHLLAFVRRVCRSKRFKYLDNNFSRNEKENFPEYCRYMASKFEEHSKLLILRVDLYITPDHQKQMTDAASDRCMKSFLRALREERVVPGVKGWICKREKGFRRGIHLHVLVAMDGHRYQRAGHYSEILGEAWKLRFSDGCGSYFNCWARRHEYPLNCLGVVHVSDRRMLMGLREAIRYLTKGHCQVQTGFHRNLFRGNDSRPVGVAKRGAPRKPEHDMSLVNAILGRSDLRL
ncbi:inovirus-type Gp2 protein [Dyella sp. GSA-30]|uniref:YagK/YfjJ domain-containing protein n=1 Tax=Dyella sp. GSA-30 TaxID=2994496 RepID=UPI002491EAEA|nr:inovirus-type Gp2 protein [Dyella sp. GSA-30]